jgi:hypothetical protein
LHASAFALIHSVIQVRVLTSALQMGHVCKAVQQDLMALLTSPVTASLTVSCAGLNCAMEGVTMGNRYLTVYVVACFEGVAQLAPTTALELARR